MHHAVYAANINKSAIVGKRLDFAVILRANFYGFPNLRSRFSPAFGKQRLDRADNTAAVPVNLGDADPLFSALKARPVRHRAEGRSGWRG